MMELIIILVVFILIIMLITLSCYKNKFKFALIKIDEAQKNIDSVLKQKKEDFDKIKPIITETLEEENFLNNLEELNVEQVGSIEANKQLADFYIELMKTIDENDKLLNNETIKNVLEDISDNEIELSASIKYYNDSTQKYNELIESFPSNIVRIIFGYKKKELYKDEKRERYEILKEK